MKSFWMHRAVRAPSNYLGAMDAGGRWNSISTPMLHTARYLSLACVEVLVHVDRSELPRDYVWLRAEGSDGLGQLPVGDLNQSAAGLIDPISNHRHAVFRVRQVRQILQRPPILPPPVGILSRCPGEVLLVRLLTQILLVD